MKTIFATLLILAFAFQATADVKSEATTNAIEELNPFDPNIEQTLEMYDAIYEQETGLKAHLDTTFGSFFANGCVREECPVWIQVDLSSQTAYLYINGQQTNSWRVSSGLPGHDTPDFDRHPNGRVYDAYTSTKYPEGDYHGLGNMPYAVFIEGGFALHGTPEGNWSKLGRRASHGCIRMHPDNAKYFNRLVRQYGVSNVWITVQ